MWHGFQSRDEVWKRSVPWLRNVRLRRSEGSLLFLYILTNKQCETSATTKDRRDQGSDYQLQSGRQFAGSLSLIIAVIILPAVEWW